MDNFYGSLIPRVVDEEMVLNSAQDLSQKYTKVDRDNVLDITSLSLSYQNILKLNNIWYLKNLSKLQLSNNIIEKIEGLEELTNLVWLDLSFNKIEKIEGLNTLKKLQDLSLFENKIKKLENMDSLENLQVFSVGNNNIADKSDVVYLRRFKKLESLTFQGNPLCQMTNYRHLVVAYMNNLVYLDYSFIKDERDEAKNIFEDDLLKLEQSDLQQEIMLKNSTKMETETNLLKKAFVHDLKGEKIISEMFRKENNEGSLLNDIPAMKCYFEEFSEKLMRMCSDLHEFGVNKLQEREIEISQFEEFLRSANGQMEETASAAIKNFMTTRDKVMTDESTMDLSKKAVFDGQKVEELKSTLLLLDVNLVDQIEETMKEFEENMTDLMNQFLDHIRHQMSECRKLENVYSEKLVEEASLALEKALASDSEDVMSRELVDLLKDKDSVNNSAKASHEIRIQILDNVEDSIISQSNVWLKKCLQEFQKREILRDRERISEISHLISSLKEEDFDCAEFTQIIS